MLKYIVIAFLIVSAFGIGAISGWDKGAQDMRNLENGSVCHV